MRHADAEAVLQKRLSSISTPADYAGILKIFYGFFQPVQALIQSHLNETHLPDINERRTATYILSDLLALGIETDQLPISSSLPRIDNAAQAFGALYVLEGSTLGGRMIKKMLQAHPSIHFTEEQLRFFNGYGEETGPKWKVFVATLNQQHDPPTIVEAANATFSEFQKWIERNHEQ